MKDTGFIEGETVASWRKVWIDAYLAMMCGRII